MSISRAATLHDMDPMLVQARRDFPILERTVYGKPLVYLDNAATTQKPQCVIDALSGYYAETNSNVHRGVHKLSQDATAAYEQARERVRLHLNAASEREIVFTRGTTESINLVAHSYGALAVNNGDEIIVSGMEHHSNIVPWQMLCERSGALLKVIPVTDAGELDMEAYAALLGDRTRIVAVVAVSNALGTVNPVPEIIRLAHAVGARVLVDAAQAMPHMQVDVRAWDCDFLALSGHKVFAPTGIGVLYGKEELLNAMPPFMGGGDMIRSVSFEKTTYAQAPQKFEAGTPSIADAIALGVALEYVRGIGYDRIAAHEQALLRLATEQVSRIDGVRIIGTAAHKSAVVSFVADGVHPHDMGTYLDREGIAVRAGHHCVQPLMKRFGVAATTRMSCAFTSTFDEVQRCADAVASAVTFFRS
ncbi:MAG: SufS family cysteine desulfurase [Candidatus Kapaibacterium sp.]